jgi:serine/threonine-protein phosphatase 6 regulatory ankyrin repeat subunit A
MHFAAACGHVGILGCFLQVTGSGMVLDDQGYSPLHWACFNGKEYVIHCFIIYVHTEIY